MQLFKRILYAFLLIAFGLGELRAQEVIPASGGNASGTGGSVSYSVGQMVYTTNTGLNGSVAQGVQQPYEISVVTGIEEAKGISLNLTAYPNPTTDLLTLKVDVSASFNLNSMVYQLIDLGGKVLENKKVENYETRIDLSNLVAATYYLKVINNSKEIKTFRIIKIKN